jgi:hypothetical protein
MGKMAILNDEGDPFYVLRQAERVRRLLAHCQMEPACAKKLTEYADAIWGAFEGREEMVRQTPPDKSAAEDPVGAGVTYTPLRIFVDLSRNPSLSMRRVYACMVPPLRHLGIRFVAEKKDADLQWDPFGGWTFDPPSAEGGIPYVSTFHGATGWFVDHAIEYADLSSAVALQPYVLRQFFHWQENMDRVTRFVVPSFFAGRELQQSLGMPPDQLTIIHHGVDHQIYRPEGESHPDVGFLHVAAHWRVIKNIERTIAAHGASGVSDPLTIIVYDWEPGDLPKGVRHIRGPLEPEELAKYYRGAKALVFATLKETFGLPVAEAMACGCPVVASYGSALEELYVDAALLVDPYSTDSIAQGIAQAARSNEAMRLRANGLLRARSFTWDRAAAAYARLFRSVVAEYRQDHPQRPGPGGAGLRRRMASWLSGAGAEGRK